MVLPRTVPDATCSQRVSKVQHIGAMRFQKAHPFIQPFLRWVHNARLHDWYMQEGSGEDHSANVLPLRGNKSRRS